MRRADIIAADGIGNRALHIFAKGIAVFVRAFVAKFDIDFRLGLVYCFDPLLNIGDTVGVFLRNFFGACFGARQLAKEFNALGVVFYGLVILRFLCCLLRRVYNTIVLNYCKYDSTRNLQ